MKMAEGRGRSSLGCDEERSSDRCSRDRGRGVPFVQRGRERAHFRTGVGSETTSAGYHAYSDEWIRLVYRSPAIKLDR